MGNKSNSEILDQISKVYNQGVKTGQEHSTPSPETRQFMNSMEEQIKEIKEDFKEFKKDHKDTPADIKYIIKSIDGMKVNYTTKAEFKPVKDLVYGLVTLILIGFVGAIIALVIK